MSRVRDLHFKVSWVCFKGSRRFLCWQSAIRNVQLRVCRVAIVKWTGCLLHLFIPDELPNALTLWESNSDTRAGSGALGSV